MTEVYYCENCGSVFIKDHEYDELKDVEKCGGEKDYGEKGKYCESAFVINSCHTKLRYWKLNETYYDIFNNPDIHFVRKVEMENRQYICPICGYKFPDFSECRDRGLKTSVGCGFSLSRVLEGFKKKRLRNCFCWRYFRRKSLL